MKTKQTLYIRKSSKLLFVKLIVSIFLVATVTAVFLGSMSFEQSQTLINTSLAIDLDIFSILLAMGAELLLVIAIFVEWTSTHYQITEGEVKTTTGFLGSHEYCYLLSELDRIELHQGVLGKLGNFGDLYLYLYRVDADPIQITEIDNPQEVESYINQAAVQRDKDRRTR